VGIAGASKRKSRAPIDDREVRALALAFPGAEEATSYGTPAFRVRGKLFARLHQDGDSLVVRADFDQREVLMQADPRAFFITDHYRDHPWILVRLASVSRDQLSQVLEHAWRERAPQRLVRELDAE